MRVLLIAPFPVFPLSHGGSVRVHRLATGLTQAGSDVEVLSPWYPGQPWGTHERDGVRWHPHRLPANILPRVLPESLAPAGWAVSLQPEALGPRRILRGLGDFDVVQFEFPWLFGWARALPASPRLVLSAHNVEYDYMRDRVRRPTRARIAARARTLEGQAVREADLVVACTDTDLRRLSELYAPVDRSVVIPNGFGTRITPGARHELRAAARAELGIAPDERVLLFLAGRAPHNVDALKALTEVVLPNTEHGTLLVVGRVAKPMSSADGRLRCVGHVDDLRPMLAVADVALNPVLLGSGSSVKMADYLAAGLPIISTPVGARGFEPFAEAITVVDLHEFAKAIDANEARPAIDDSRLDELSAAAIGERLLHAYQGLPEPSGHSSAS